MWRLWTRGWGPRAWWFWFKNEAFPMWCAWRVPRYIALWVFIRVYCADGCSPGPDYERVYKAWEAGEGR